MHDARQESLTILAWLVHQDLGLGWIGWILGWIGRRLGLINILKCQGLDTTNRAIVYCIVLAMARLVNKSCLVSIGNGL